MNVGLSREDVFCRSKWIGDVNQFATKLRLIWPPSIDATEHSILLSLCVYLYWEKTAARVVCTCQILNIAYCSLSLSVCISIGKKQQHVLSALVIY